VHSGGVGPAQRVLDIGAGDGPATATASAAGADVETAAVADAAALPHGAGAFDRVVSAFGVIHAPTSAAPSPRSIACCAREVWLP
jgi:hypothetical protein